MKLIAFALVALNIFATVSFKNNAYAEPHFFDCIGDAIEIGLFGKDEATHRLQQDILSDLRRVTHTVPLQSDELSELNLFIQKLNHSELVKLRDLKEHFTKNIKLLNDPFSITSHLHDLKTLLKFYEHVLLNKTSQAKTVRISQWIDSPEKAVFAYDFFQAYQFESFLPILEKLIKFNPNFEGAIKTRGPPNSLLTFSFEKESSSPAIGLLYKDPKFSNEEWFELNENVRLKHLKNLTQFKKKEALPSSVVDPTPLHPNYLGGFSQEISLSQLMGYTWEVNHKKFEISLNRALEQVREISKMLNETDSFHFHISFEIPENETSFKKFIQWFKQKNDFLYLQGMEEGLHGNHLTTLPLNREINIIDKANAFLGTQYALPRNLDEVDKRTFKFFNMGLRGNIYGGSSSKQFKRIGVELRDITRNLDKLEKNVRYIASEISEHRWNNFPIDLAQQSNLLKLDPSVEFAKESLLKWMQPKYAELVSELEPLSGIPFAHFSSGKIWSFEKNLLNEPNFQISERIQNATQNYILAMQAVEKELIKMEQNKEIIPKDLVKAAIRWNLTDWAKQALASELYQ